MMSHVDTGKALYKMTIPPVVSYGRDM